MSDALTSWNDGAARQAIVAFVERAVSAVPVEERVAVFDNDGTLWCEKPLPIQADFILRRLFEMARADPQLRDRQPWKAAYERDYGWLGTVLAEHYAGDDTNVRTLLGGVLAAFGGITVEDFEAQSDAFLRRTQHPTLGRPYLKCAYAPMLELLAYLEDNGFSNYIASGGGRDFMRPISDEVYGIPRERVIGSATALDYVADERGGAIIRRPEADYVDDGPQKPIRIWSRVGRRPLLATGNSNGDIRCSISPSIRTSHSSRCSWFTTTPIASLTTPPGQSRRWSARTRTPGRRSASSATGPASFRRRCPPCRGARHPY
jgi:phosphoglycolate phosphatase-like HAD superfamily hydrolase